MHRERTEAEITAALQRERAVLQDATRRYAARLLEAQIAGSQWVKACMAAGDLQAGEHHDPRQVLLFDMYRQQQHLRQDASH
ncbi:hypothetical protein [Zoogloea sp.]|uniref:hypothetical protein n=1 Tax=Zoogloea sp. TaxID=49181 RepID=UPI002588F50F|nr:hypothetical protein [Zoogloea sp.]MDD2670114.1 hypothetical protein [Zoogloea sp.]